jgi:signal transduction histidine kinase
MLKAKYLLYAAAISGSLFLLLQIIEYVQDAFNVKEKIAKSEGTTKRLSNTATDIFNQVNHADTEEKIRLLIDNLEEERKEFFLYDDKQNLEFWSGKSAPHVIVKDKIYRPKDGRICIDKNIKNFSYTYCEYIDFAKNKNEYNSLSYSPVGLIKWLKLIFYLISIASLILWVLKESKQARSIKFTLKTIGVITLFIILSLSTKFYNCFQPIGIFTPENFYLGKFISAGAFFVSGTLFLVMSIIISRVKLDATSSLVKVSSIGVAGIMIGIFIGFIQITLNGISGIQFEILEFSAGSQIATALGSIHVLMGILILFRKGMALRTKTSKGKIISLCVFLISYLLCYLILGLTIPLIPISIFLVIYYFTGDISFEQKSQNITWLIWWMIIHAAFLASVLYFYSIQQEIKTLKSNLVKLYQPSNRIDADFISDLDKEIYNTELINKISILPNDAKLSESDIISYLETELDTLSHFLIKSIHFFEISGRSRLINSFQDHSTFKNSVRNFSAINKSISYDPFSGAYLIKNTTLKNFYIIIEEKEKPTVDLDQYGIYINNKLNYGQLDIPPELLSIASIDTIITDNAISNIISRPTQDVVLYTNKTYASLLKPISLFSYIFCLEGLFIFLFTIFNSRFRILDNLPLYLDSFSSLRIKIQLVIISLILLSFFSIAWITSIYFNQILKSNQQESITNKVITINNALQYAIKNVYDRQSAENVISNEIDMIASINDVNATFYDTSGYNYNRSISNEKLFPYYPYYNVMELNKNQTFTKIKSVNDIEAYFPLQHSTMGLLGFISIHNKPNKRGGTLSITDFLSSILNVYVFLFLIAGAIAIAVSRSITRPLTELGRRLNTLKVGTKNEVIKWETQDEIGELIQNYNEMVEKLDQNVSILTKTERDMAWREMAKQVAHEIKNPLTPMKLSIQYLEQAIKKNPENSKELVKRISNTLIEQIDNLSGIASAFSNFATLPKASNEKVILNEVVEVIHDLFRKREDMDIKLTEPINEIYVFADKNHLIRILNNIVKNAIQSIPDTRKGRIEISLYKQDDKAIIKINDNGTGISDDMKDKVFTPNFTTKSSGTGLGLAISLNMINSFNGNIYFETEYGEGTDFFVEVPLMKDNYLDKGGNRVSLD